MLGDSLTHPMLLTFLFLSFVQPDGHREPRNEVESLILPTPPGGLNQEPTDSNITPSPTELLSQNILPASFSGQNELKHH